MSVVIFIMIGLLVGCVTTPKEDKLENVESEIVESTDMKSAENVDIDEHEVMGDLHIEGAT